MRVLAIGNSFSQDASRYLHQIAEADGIDIEMELLKNVERLNYGSSCFFTVFCGKP